MKMTVNIEYLMEYLSRRLHTRVQIFNMDGTCIYNVCMRADLEQKIDAELFTELKKTACEKFPVIVADPGSAAYVLIVAEAKLYIMGPVQLIRGNVCRHSLSDRLLLDSLSLTLYQCSTTEILKEGVLLHNIFSGFPCSLEEAVEHNCLDRDIKYEIQKKFSDIIFENQENSSMHNPYDQEIREVKSIRSGNADALKKSWQEDYIGKLGVLAKTPLRSNQNLAIVLVTLASRAAMESGVMAETAYSLSDSYINKIEEAKNPEWALQLGRQAEMQYALLIREINESRKYGEKKDTAADSRTSRCKDYIFSHLHEKISTQDIAKALYMNQNYLSDLFRRSEGITISDYILNEKIKLVKNMLIYSRYSYSQIASYLGFCSQSYLGTKFKKVTGCTMHQFRERYGRKDFSGQKL